MTSQELFDFVVTKIRAQGRRSYDGEICVYRGPDGLRCAAGWLISDEHYSPELERKTTDTRIVQNALRMSNVQEGQFDLVRSLQEAHDESFDEPNFVSVFLARARVVAARFNLDPGVTQ